MSLGRLSDEKIPASLRRSTVAIQNLDHEGKHEEANELREEIMERLRASVGRGVQ
jgi:hypothetical protein